MNLSRLSWKDKIRYAVLALVALYFLVLLILNLQRTRVDFFFLAVDIPVIVLILISALFGAGLMWGVLTFKGGRRKGDAPES
jgi:uncharacterized integral membrane protein